MEKNQQGVKILGGGCDKCNQLEKATIKALSELGMDTTIDHVKDFEKIAAFGVMTTPALVVDGKVVSYGKVLKKDDFNFDIGFDYLRNPLENLDKKSVFYKATRPPGVPQNAVVPNQPSKSGVQPATCPKVVVFPSYKIITIQKYGKILSLHHFSDKIFPYQYFLISRYTGYLFFLQRYF